MEENNIFDQINNILGHKPECINILEEEIDVELQMDYFESSKRNRDAGVLCDINELAGEIFDISVSPSKKRGYLVQLASLDDVEAYRVIEKYLKQSDDELKEWAILAFQESRMVVQSKLLDENQVFISTGLGGKDEKLRFFLVLIHKEKQPFNELQQHLIKEEFTYYLEQVGGEIEEVKFEFNFCTILTLLPLDVSIRELFTKTVAGCNEFGDFIESDFILTNVKKLSFDEIIASIHKGKDSDDQTNMI